VKKGKFRKEELLVSQRLTLSEVGAVATGLDAKLLFNRELSWIEFNRRVLEEALNSRRPLLERLKFSAIFSTNLDEFFMIRVSALKQQAQAEVPIISPDGLTPAEQLAAISQKLHPLINEQMRCLREEILPQLATHGILIAPYAQLNAQERTEINAYFHEHIFPVLTPLAVDPSHPFPYISNLSLNLAVFVVGANEEEMPAHFARIKVPPVISRLLPITVASGHKFVLLEEVIAANLDSLFPEMNIIACHPFRTTRNAEIEIEEDEADDLLKMMEQQLRQRRFGSCVRLEIDTTMPAPMVEYLRREIDVEPNDISTVNGPLHVPDLMALYKLDYPVLKEVPFTPALAPPLNNDENIFEIIKRQDVILHHPYDSFAPVVDFIAAAAVDPNVLAIKQTLYRTSGDSPIVSSLIAASENGKQVAVLVELKARFDEENNIIWARKMERSGVHVVYGLMGVKTHCKVALVVRQEGGAIRRYVHLGTGNYNPNTAKVYTDIGLLTCNPEIGADVSELFNFLTGYSRQRHYRKLLVAPIQLRERMISLIEREIEQCQAGRPARIIAKLNSITDPKIIQALYQASQAGIPIDLIVRGICCLRPGIPGVSENIRVISIVGRFLEHSRIFYFANGGQEEVYVGSADWMQRNMDRRIEVLFPIQDERLCQRLKNEVLEISLADNVGARQLLPTGEYQRLRPAPSAAIIDSQHIFLQMSTSMINSKR
jgi:polyphosphate kinase